MKKYNKPTIHNYSLRQEERIASCGQSDKAIWVEGSGPSQSWIDQYINSMSVMLYSLEFCDFYYPNDALTTS